MNYSRFIVIFALQLHVLIEAELYIKDPIDYGLISPSLPTNADFIPGSIQKERGFYYGISKQKHGPYDPNFCAPDYEPVQMTSENNLVIMKRFARDYQKMIWVSRISGLTANCNSAASCNGSLYFESGKPMHMYDWMDSAISIDLWTTDTCVVISWSEDLIGRDCNDPWFYLCKLKERMPWKGVTKDIKCYYSGIGNSDWRYLESSLLPESSSLSDIEDCALSCAFNINCMYWSHKKDRSECRLLPSGALMNTGPTEYDGEPTKRSDRFCYPQVCAEPPAINNANHDWDGTVYDTGGTIL